MKRIKILLAVLVLCSKGVSAQSPADSAAVNAILQEEITAWNTKDAVLYSKHFSPDGTFTNILGMFFTGHTVFQQRHDEIFKGVFAGTQLQYRLTAMRYASPVVIIIQTLASVSGFSPKGPPPGSSLDKEGRLNCRLLQVLVKTGNDWQIVAYHNTAIAAGMPIPEFSQK